MASPARLDLLVAEQLTIHQMAVAFLVMAQTALRPMEKTEEPGLPYQVAQYAADRLARYFLNLQTLQNWPPQRQEPPPERTGRLIPRWSEAGPASHQNHLTMES